MQTSFSQFFSLTIGAILVFLSVLYLQNFVSNKNEIDRIIAYKYPKKLISHRLPPKKIAEWRQSSTAVTKRAPTERTSQAGRETLLPSSTAAPIPIGRPRNEGGRFAIVTMATDVTYIPAVQTLGFSLSKWIQNDTELVVFVLKGSVLTPVEWTALRSAGWKLRFVEKIKAPRPTSNRYGDQFTKLWLWNMTEYEKVMYMDGDMLSLKPMGDLLHLNISLGAARDWGGNSPGTHWPSFNAGFLVVRPSRQEFQRLMSLLKQNRVQYEAAWSEQGWLNALYGNDWFELSSFNDMVSAVYYLNSRVWKSVRPFIRGLHITNWKPFLEVYINELDHDRDNRVNRIWYFFHDEMVQSWGQSFTIVSFLTCSTDSALVQKIIERLKYPLVLYNLCDGRNLDQMHLEFSKRKVLVANFSEDLCKSAQKLHEVWRRAPKLIRRFPNVGEFIGEFCKVNLLTRVATSDPFLSHFHHWIDFETLLHSEEAVNSVNIWQKSFDGVDLHPRLLDVSVGFVDASQNKSSIACTMKSFGGTRDALQNFWGRYKLSVDWIIEDISDKNRTFSALDVCLCLIIADGDKRKATDDSLNKEKSLHLIRKGKLLPQKEAERCRKNCA